MSFLRYDDALKVLLVTKGHPFERDPFFALFESLEGIAATHVEQPAAQAFFEPERARPWDAFVFYDMPGIEFRPGAAVFHDPPPEYQKGFRELLDVGHGFVFLHHAVAGWPSWPEYAEIVGGRFLYLPGELRGEALPDSGYRMGQRHRVSAVAEHPVLDGLEEGFEIEDELYLFLPFEEEVTPLLRSDYEFVEGNFHSAARVVEHGEMFSREGWSHPPGSNLIAWTHRVGRSPIVTILCGDGPSAYENPGLRRLIGNAIRWVASSASRESG